MQAPVPFELTAPAHWRVLDFIADLHLHPGAARSLEAWRHHLRHTPADAVFILGDLFEVWVGDDAAALPGHFAAACAQILAEVTPQRAVFFMHGNRDFLVGADFFARTGVQPLPDPTVLGFGGARWLLSHGDALCTADTAYQAFRRQVRSPGWQADFLGRPLAEREALARALREQSMQHQRSLPPAQWADVDAPAACAWLRAARAPVLIHGHTHRPAVHELACDDLPHARRIVLSDWDLEAAAPRAEVLRLASDGAWQRLPPD